MNDVLEYQDLPVYITRQVSQEFNVSKQRILNLYHSSGKLIESIDYFNLQGDSLEKFKEYAKEKDRDMYELSIKRVLVLYLWTKAGIDKIGDLLYSKPSMIRSDIADIQDNLHSIICLLGMDCSAFGQLLDTSEAEIKGYVLKRKRLTAPVAFYIVDKIADYLEDIEGCGVCRWQGRPADILTFLKDNEKYFKNVKAMNKLMILCQKAMDGDDSLDYFDYKLAELLSDELRVYLGLPKNEKTFNGYSLLRKYRVPSILELT